MGSAGRFTFIFRVFSFVFDTNLYYTPFFDFLQEGERILQSNKQIIFRIRRKIPFSSFHKVFVSLNPHGVFCIHHISRDVRIFFFAGAIFTCHDNFLRFLSSALRTPHAPLRGTYPQRGLSQGGIPCPQDNGSPLRRWRDCRISLRYAWETFLQ